MLGHRGPGVNWGLFLASNWHHLHASFPPLYPQRTTHPAPCAPIIPTLTRVLFGRRELRRRNLRGGSSSRVRTARSLKVSFRCRPAITLFRRHFVHTLTKTSPYPANGIPVRAHVLVRIKFAPKAVSVEACPTLHPNADTLGVRRRGRSEDSKTMTDKIVWHQSACFIRSLYAIRPQLLSCSRMAARHGG